MYGTSYVSEADKKHALRLLSQLTDAQLATIDAGLGCLPLQMRRQVADYREASGRGFVLGRLIPDAPHLSDADFRTFCFAMMIAARVSLRCTDLVKGITGEVANTSYGSGSVTPSPEATPALTEAWADVGAIISSYSTKGMNGPRPWQELMPYLLPATLMLEFGLAPRTAMRMCVRAATRAAETTSWEAAAARWPFGGHPKMVGFWCEVAQQLQSAAPFKASVTEYQTLFGSPPILDPTMGTPPAWIAAGAKGSLTDRGAGIDAATLNPTTTTPEAMLAAFERGDPGEQTAMTTLRQMADEGDPGFFDEEGDPDEPEMGGFKWGKMLKRLKSVALKAARVLPIPGAALVADLAEAATAAPKPKRRRRAAPPPPPPDEEDEEYEEEGDFDESGDIDGVMS